MLPPPALNYILLALEGTPDVLESLLNAFAYDDPVWDLRPNPDRFTLREILAHLADWEPIFLERITRMRDEDTPHLPDVDEGQLAVARDYAHVDAPASLMRFRQGRAQLLPVLRALPVEAWERPGFRERIGPLTLENLVVLILGHDGYHTRQIAQWLAACHHAA